MNCLTALSQINTFSYPLIFRPRPPTHSSAVFLPMRYLSTNGRCVIDLFLKDGSPGDVSNGVGIYNAAHSVMQQCVTRQMAGFATGFSECTFTYLAYQYVRLEVVPDILLALAYPLGHKTYQMKDW